MSSKASPKRQKGHLAAKDENAAAPAASGHRRRHLSHPQRHALSPQQHHHHQVPHRQLKDTEENVAAQTDCVFRHFVYQMYVNDVTSETTDDDLPSLPEVRKINEQPVT